jgi:hypothetical protein
MILADTIRGRESGHNARHVAGAETHTVLGRNRLRPSVTPSEGISRCVWVSDVFTMVRRLRSGRLGWGTAGWCGVYARRIPGTQLNTGLDALPALNSRDPEAGPSEFVGGRRKHLDAGQPGGDVVKRSQHQLRDERLADQTCDAVKRQHSPRLELRRES